MTDKPVKVVRMRMEIEERDGYACAMVSHMDSDAPSVEVLRAPAQRCEGDEVRDEFLRLAARMARDMGQGLGEEEPPAPEAPAPEAPAVNDAETELDIQVAEGEGFVFAYMAQHAGMVAPPHAQFARLVAVATPFMAHESVRDQFHKLVEAVGLVLVQLLAEESKAQGMH